MTDTRNAHVAEPFRSTLNDFEDATAQMARSASCQPIPDINPAIRLIGALGELFHNGDTHATEAVLDAVQAGRAAYASKGLYSNQKAGRLVISANRAGLPYALRDVANDEHSSHAAHTPYLLGTLIPLNRQAHVELERAWFDWDEMRRDKQRAERVREDRAA